MAKESLEQKVKNMEETMKSFQREIERLQAVNEIQNLMSKYEYLHTANRHKDVMELYAKNAPGVRVYWGELGYWEGPDAPKRVWGILDRLSEKARTGMMAIHPTTTPVIEVAADGKTAKGVWTGTGFVARNSETGEPQAMWEWDKYGVDFIKEDGKWKFWHLHIYRIFRSRWDKGFGSWDPDAAVSLEIPDEHKPDGPAVDDYPYRRDTLGQLAPVPPEPYDTFDPKNMY
jgi:hypothetical protein